MGDTTQAGTTGKRVAGGASPTRRSWRRIVWRGIGLLLVVGLIGYYALPKAFPLPPALLKEPEESAKIADRQGKPLRTLPANAKGRQGTLLSYEDLPASLINATLSAEDQRFWAHGGIDFVGLVRASVDSVEARRAVSGASTITQQLIKVGRNRYQGRTFKDKVLEVFTARHLEMVWPKERIIAEYLSRIEYGNQRVGAAAAAEGYFNKSLSDLSLAEAAFLAGLPQAPTRLNPYRFFDRAKKRQEWILARMVDDSWITEEECTQAQKEPIQLRRWQGGFVAPHFVEHLMVQKSWPQQLQETQHGQPLLTTLDTTLQQHCEAVIGRRLRELSDQDVKDGAVVVLDNPTGGILALVGGADYHRPDMGQINAATTPRSAGSTLKPFIYRLAFAQGLPPCSLAHDLPIEFMTPTGIYRPENYDRRAYGPVSLREALASSLNLAAVRLLQRVGGPSALMAELEACGLTTLQRSPEEYGLGLAIGNAEVTLLELANGYATLARGGRWLPAVGWLNEALAAPEVPPPAQDGTCWLVADVLADNQARQRGFGLASPLRLPFPAAVKTGTSTDFRDNWCVGFTPEVTVAVWMGNLDRRPMRHVSGVSGSAPVWRDIMQWLAEKRPLTWFERPEFIVPVAVDTLTGERVPLALAQKRPTVTALCLEGARPAEAPSSRYDALGRVFLPREYGPWLRSRSAWTGAHVLTGSDSLQSPPLASGSSHSLTSTQHWSITSPLDGTIFWLDPDLPESGNRLRLKARGAPQVEWASPSLILEGQGDSAWVRLQPGIHEIAATDAQRGLTTRVKITVKSL